MLSQILRFSEKNFSRFGQRTFKFNEYCSLSVHFGLVNSSFSLSAINKKFAIMSSPTQTPTHQKINRLASFNLFLSNRLYINYCSYIIQMIKVIFELKVVLGY